jgi:hypothetical protein
MSKLKELATKYGVTASLIGGSLVVGTVFGQCVLSPPSVTVEEPAIAADEAPPAEPEGAAAPEESDD